MKHMDLHDHRCAGKYAGDNGNSNGSGNGNDNDNPNENEESDAPSIRSDRAFLARAYTDCEACGRRIEVVCVYCETGVVDDEALEQFTVQRIMAVDAGLARELTRWPEFRFDEEYGCYVNHCPGCGAAQDEDSLHSEPDQPFFDVLEAAGCAVQLSPLAGPITLAADYSADV